MSVREGDYYILTHPQLGSQRIGAIKCDDNCRGVTDVLLDGPGVNEHTWEIDTDDDSRGTYTIKSSGGSYADSNSGSGGTQVVARHDDVDEDHVKWYLQPVQQFPGYYTVSYYSGGKIWSLGGDQPGSRVYLQDNSGDIGLHQVFYFRRRDD